MPPLLIPALSFLDYSDAVCEAPEDQQRVRLAAVSAQEIVDRAGQGDFALLFTLGLREYLAPEAWNWSPPSPASLLGSIYRHLTSYITRGEGVYTVNVANVKGHEPHPLPRGDECKARADDWADQVGRVLLLHDLCEHPSAECFIGVTCCSAFAGGAVGEYQPGTKRTFPLVGPKELPSLFDAFEWEVGDEILTAKLTTRDLCRNLGKLYDGKITNGKGSHRIVTFSNNSRWTYTANWKYVDDAILRQLEKKLPVPFCFIKHTLVVGSPPNRQRLRLSAVASIELATL